MKQTNFTKCIRPRFKFALESTLFFFYWSQICPGKGAGAGAAGAGTDPDDVRLLLGDNAIPVTWGQLTQTHALWSGPTLSAHDPPPGSNAHKHTHSGHSSTLSCQVPSKPAFKRQRGHCFCCAALRWKCAAYHYKPVCYSERPELIDFSLCSSWHFSFKYVPASPCLTLLLSVHNEDAPQRARSGWVQI